MRSLAVALPAAALAIGLALLARAEDAGVPAPLAVEELLLTPVDAGAPSSGFAPDPAPLVTRHQWVAKLGYRSGQLSFRGARPLELAKPAATARSFGRFAVELYVGKELVDRVRFDFPLLGTDDVGVDPSSGAVARDHLRDAPPRFAAKLDTQATVTVPSSERATRAVLVDRATGSRWPLPWPFTAPADAGRS